MTAPVLELLPAVDVQGGQAVRLVQGEAGTETAYGAPLEAALAFQDGGASWLHLVDLDAAFGRGSNASMLAEVVDAVEMDVELSGGIRDDESLAGALATGCRRVNLGTAALENPEWTAEVLAEHGDRIAVGLDVRGTTLAARGWTRQGGDLYETPERLDEAPCAARTWTCCGRCARARRRRSSPPAGSPPSRTCARCASWSRTGWRARSSARPCTHRRSRWVRRSTSRDAHDPVVEASRTTGR